jgi:ATP-dependent HslUV protease ATP-binding subunit HslU
MVRELVENAIALVRERERAQVEAEAQRRANNRLVDLLCPPPARYSREAGSSQTASTDDSYERTRAKFTAMLDAGELDERKVEVTIETKPNPVMVGGIGVEHMDVDFQGMLEKIMPKSTVRRELPVVEARKVIFEQECDALLEPEKINARAIALAENLVIIFLEELDKIVSSDAKGTDGSRQGVQRDLLPIVEGTTVQTKYGYLRTDHILFIAAGAFHKNKPSDLMPELQGRFPIRVELDDLTKDDFVRILTEPKNSLTHQYKALLNAEGVDLDFTADAIAELAHFAFRVNQTSQNIGARRLYTILETVLDEVSFDAADLPSRKVVIDAGYVQQRLKAIAEDEDLSKFIL